MLKKDIVVGKFYLMKVSDKVVPVRVDSVSSRGWSCTNQVTGKSCSAKSASKFRCECDKNGRMLAKKPLTEEERGILPVNAEQVKQMFDAKDRAADATRPATLQDKLECFDEQTDKEVAQEQAPFAASGTNPTSSPDDAAAATADEGEQGSDPTSLLNGTGRDTGLGRPQVGGVTQLGAGSLGAALSKPRRKPTPEQQAILDAVRKLGRGDVLLVQAGAGAGKTTTQVMIEEVLGGRGQYTAFNKSLVKESSHKFKRAACNTTHSLAFRAIGKRYAKRLDSERVKSRDIARMLGLGDFSVPMPTPDNPENFRILEAGFLAGQVMQAVKRFCQSADREIGEGHVKYVDGLDMPQDGKRTYANNNLLRQHLLPFCQRAWADLSDPDGKLPFSHDVYVKVWQLEEPVISADYIMLDEAQDTAEVMLDILKQQTALLIIVGDSAQCQPSGTMVTVVKHYRRGNRFTGHVPTTYEQVPIEEVQVGDQVASYAVANSFFRRTGSPVLRIAQRPFKGKLVKVTLANGASSSYTPDHRCVVRIGDALNGKWVVYLMRKGRAFRVGMVKGMYESQMGDLGLPKRMRTEGADAGWVLDVFDTESEARLAEACIAWGYGIPSLRFRNNMKTGMPQEELSAFWTAMDDLTPQADTLLRAFGRRLAYPICSGDLSMFRNRGSLVAACNLIDGMLVLPMTGALEANGKRATKNKWETITVSQEQYNGVVHSLKVANDETYVADGIITHNSIYEWRGAINAMAAFPQATELTLSQSFRFGQAIADVANQILAEIPGITLRLRGFDQVPSTVGPVAKPHCILTRTNAAAIGAVLAAMQDGERPHLIGGGGDVIAFVEASLALQEGKPTSHPELACFGNWAEVQAYVKEDEGEDLKLMVKLIDSFGAETILSALKRMPTEDQATLTVCTAHKSKGREWDTVKLAHDFPTLSKASEPDLKLIYVAATRAKIRLDVTECPFFTGEDALELLPSPEGFALPEAPISPPTPSQPPPDKYTWAKDKDGKWRVRGPAGQEGQKVQVFQRNGSSEWKTLTRQVGRSGDACLYESTR